MIGSTQEISGEGAAVVGGAHAFVLFASRITGLAPVQFTRLAGPTRARTARWLLHLSKFQCILSCLLLSILGIILYIS